jgi:hypothetical protein
MAHSSIRGELDYISQNMAYLLETVSDLEMNVVTSAQRLNEYDKVDAAFTEKMNDFGNVSNVITSTYAELTQNLASFRTSIEQTISSDIFSNILRTDQWIKSSDGANKFYFESNGVSRFEGSLAINDENGVSLFDVNTETNTVSIHANLVADGLDLGRPGFGNLESNVIDCDILNANVVNATELKGAINVNFDDVMIDSTVIFENIEEVFNLSSLRIPNGKMYIGETEISSRDNSLVFRNEMSNSDIFEITGAGELIGNGSNLTGLVKIGDPIVLQDVPLTIGDALIEYDDGLKINSVVNIDGSVAMKSVSANSVTLSPDLVINSGKQKLTNQFNIAIGGSNCLQNANNVSHCIGIGHKTLGKIAESSDCIAIGSESLGLCTGPGSVAIGKLSSASLQEGKYNTSVGTGSHFYSKSGVENACLGYRSGYTLTGNRSTAIGSYSLHAAPGMGHDCTAIGHGSLKTTYLGNVHSFNNVTAIGSSTACTGNNQVILGAPTSDVYTFKPIQVISDARDLFDISDESKGLDFINSLRPRSFKYKPRNGGPPGTRTHHGFVSQDLISNNITDFYQDHTVNGGENVFSISYGEMIAPLVKSIQELHEKVNALTNVP